jgi:gliding motility-associated-like protein
MKKYILLFSFCLLLLRGIAQIGGVINTYTPVTAIVCNSVTVTNASGFYKDDLVLLIQMKGATIDLNNTPSFGSVLNYNNCGNFELQTISSITGNTIFFKYTILKNYSASGMVQLVRIPQYTNTSVTSTLTCKPWDGSSGGIVALVVLNNLTLKSSIDVSGKGFRGGTQCNNPDGDCGPGYTDYYYPLSSGLGAEKGEGINSALDATMDGGRGPSANGGGGGNKHNSGGGGGGNYSAGGKGGDQASICPADPVGGIGGNGLDYGQSKIFMGGGGGCSDNNDNVGTPGAGGGGIVIIVTNTIIGNGNFCIANGDNAGTLANSIGDGAGGGGGGGTILLDIKNYTGILNIQANGGNGGDQNTDYNACFGPGGGGGCGVIEFATGVLPGNVTATTTQGMAGTDVNAASPCYQSNYGATAGKPGKGFKYNLPIPKSTTPAYTLVDIGNDTTLCEPPIELKVLNTAAISYLWSTNETTPVIRATTPGTYWVSVTFPNCPVPITDTIKVKTSALNIIASRTPVTCKGSCNATAIVDVTDGNAPFTYSWNTPIIQTTAEVTGLCAGTYRCTVTENKGCKKMVDVTISEPELLQVKLTTNDERCTVKGLAKVVVSGGTAPYIYHWEPGTSQADTISNLKAGKYTITISDKNGCRSAQSFQIKKATSGTLADLNANPTTTDQFQPEIKFTNLSTDAVTHVWDFGDGTLDSIHQHPVHVYADTGTYQACLRIVNKEQCLTEKCETIVIRPVWSFYIPNAFSPNGDELNEKFAVRGSGITDYQLFIYDRWGRLVFKSTEIKEQWNGKKGNDGDLEKEDVYVYLFIVKDGLKKEHRYTGKVTLVR